MSKCSLFGVLTYVTNFVWVAFAISSFGDLEEEEKVIYILGSFICMFYVFLNLRKAKKTDISIQAKLKSPLIEPKAPITSMFICFAVPFIAHKIFNLTILGDMLVCVIVSFSLFYGRNTGRELFMFLNETMIYKVILEDKGNINLIIKKRDKWAKIDVDDILEISHISGNYYLLKNVIKQEKNNNAEEPQEKELP